MSTTAFAPVQKETGKIFLPQKEKPVPILIKEQIKNQKELENLEAQYKNGEISRFKYIVNKAILKSEFLSETLKPKPKFSTTA